MRTSDIVVATAIFITALASCSRPQDTRRLDDPSKQTLETPRSSDQLSALRNRLATTQRDN